MKSSKTGLSESTRLFRLIFLPFWLTSVTSGISYFSTVLLYLCRPSVPASAGRKIIEEKRNRATRERNSLTLISRPPCLAVAHCAHYCTKHGTFPTAPHRFTEFDITINTLRA